MDDRIMEIMNVRNKETKEQRCLPWRQQQQQVVPFGLETVLWDADAKVLSTNPVLELMTDRSQRCESSARLSFSRTFNVATFGHESVRLKAV